MQQIAHRLDARFKNLKGFLFIVTYGRSGSTLLQNILMTIPDCIIRGENYNIIQSIYEASQSARRARAKWHGGGEDKSNPWFGANLIKPEVFENRLIDNFIGQVLVPPSDARWIGFKEIRFVRMEKKFPHVLDFMRRKFKNAHFVFNKRDAADVVKSGWWPKHDKDEVLAMITRMDRQMESYHRAHPEYTSLVNYSEYCSDLNVLRPVFENIGEPFNAEAIRLVMDRRLTH